jgi:ABC-2 type transport system permease protein
MRIPSASKYWQMFLITWQNGFVYPVSLLFWRLRQFLSTFMSLTIWTVLFVGQKQAFGYQESQMITYIFLTGILQSMIVSTLMGGLSEDIYTGKISYQLIKPMNIFLYLGAQELADKLKNFVFIIGETLLLFLLFKPEIVFPSPVIFFLFFLTAILGTVLMFVIMLLFGTIGFWSPETWGPRFLFYMFLEFTAGKLFPLSIFPEIVQKILFCTPFPYLTYAQSQIFLGRYTGSDISNTFLSVVFWIIFLSAAFLFLWRKGIKEYGALGH